MAQASSPSRDPGASRGAHVGPPLPTGTLIAFIIAVLAIVLVAVLSYGALESSLDSSRRVTHTLQTVEQLQALLSTLQDAETGQRGFLLSGNETYLVPYTNASAALDNEFINARRLLVGNSEQLARLDILQRLAADKMSELAQTISMRRGGDSAGALALVRTNRGKEAMERARATIAEMQQNERGALTIRQAEWLNTSSVSALVVLGGSGLLLALVSAAAMKTSRDYRIRQTQVWARTGQMGLAARIQGEQLLETLGNHVLAYLAGFLDARIGAVFVAEPENRLRRVAGYGLVKDTRSATMQLGEGSLGQAAQENRVIHIREVPADYMIVNSSVGHSTPREIVITPTSVDGIVYGAVELGFFRRLRLEDLELREEELRVNNEELEEQGRTLRESRAQLESQQAELEQINSQLEEQAQTLEDQKRRSRGRTRIWPPSPWSCSARTSTRASSWRT
jgi:CHASE3 domain sensor protein